jgi:hypothetical protein
MVLEEGTMRGLLGCSIGLDGGGLDGDVRFIRRSGRRAKLQLQTCQECILNSYHQRIQELRNWLH